MATSRDSVRSVARYTSPIPPAPSSETISYGPIRAPAVRLKEVRLIIAGAGRLSICGSITNRHQQRFTHQPSPNQQWLELEGVPRPKPLQQRLVRGGQAPPSQ